MATLQVDSIADTYISLANSSTNYGSDTLLSISWENGVEECRGLYKFDRDSIIAALGGGTVTDVKLYMYAINKNSTSDSYVPKRTDNWVESTVTWATRPSTLYTGSSFTFSSLSYVWQYATITDVWNNQTSGSVFSVLIECYTDFGFIVTHTKENASGYRAYLYITYTPACSTYDNVYVNTSTGNDANCGDVVGSPVKTFVRAYALLNSGGTLHVLNSGADFSAETLTLNKSFSIDLNGADGYWYGPQGS